MAIALTRRQLLYLGAGVTAVGVLSACDKADSGTGSAESALVTVPNRTGTSWFNRMEAGVAQYAKDSGQLAYFQGSALAEAAAQAKVLQGLITAKVAALIVTPYPSDEINQLLDQAMAADIIVITHQATNTDHCHYDLEAFHDSDYGNNLMQELASRMNETGEYVQLVSSQQASAQMAWLTAAQQYQEANYPNLARIVDPIETNNDIDQAYQKTQELLTAYPDLAGIQGFAFNDVIGAGRAVAEAGLQEQIVVCGSATPKAASELLTTGAIDCIQFWDPAAVGYAANIAAKLLIDGKKIGDGNSLEAPGYTSISVVDKVIYGENSWINVTTDNLGDYDF